MNWIEFATGLDWVPVAVYAVMVTHNLDLAKRYADLILELGAGGSVRQKLGERS